MYGEPHTIRGTVLAIDSADPEAKKLKVPMPLSGALTNVRIERIQGMGTFSVRIFQNSSFALGIDAIFEHLDEDTASLDIQHPGINYRNVDGDPVLWLVVYPSVGNDNDFVYQIDAFDRNQ